MAQNLIKPDRINILPLSVDEGFSAIFDITGVDLTIFNPSFAEKTIRGRMSETQCTSSSEYIEYLKTNPAETSKLKAVLNNNFSEFFRNTLTFAYLEHQILPTIAADKLKKRNQEIRIWSAACAAGQEAYSIAILCDEFAKNHHSDIGFRIFATDISETEIQNAQKGFYPENALRNVTYDRIKKYFSPKGDRLMVHASLREYINFSTFDLLNEDCLCPSASIFGNFDIIFCANLLFYYKPGVQQRILRKADHCLASKGWLIVGDAEKEITESNTNYISYKHLPLFQKPE